MLAYRRERVAQTHLLRDKLSLNDPDYKKALKLYFQTQLELDLPSGKEDITSSSLLDLKREISAECHVKEDGIIAGTEELVWLLSQFKGVKEVFSDCIDGEFVKKQRVCLYLKGKAGVLLKLERAIVNLLQRMSGVATFASQLVHEAAKINPYVLICPTRKTFLGPLDKKAVMLGGGGTHRIYLSDAILIKENHLKSSELPLEKAVAKVLAATRLNPIFIEFEAESSGQAVSMARELVEIQKRKKFKTPLGIMFDNFSPPLISQTLAKIEAEGLYENLFFEASGGIGKHNLMPYVKTGVDIISMGELTNQSRALDISMLVEN